MEISSRLVFDLAGWWDQALRSGWMVLRPPSHCPLQTWQSTILVVSHDRNFLNAVATDIIHLHSQRLDTYRGDFENFMKIKEERLKNQQREYEAQQQYREHIQVLGEADSAGTLFSQPCPFLHASRPMDAAVLLQRFGSRVGWLGPKGTCGSLMFFSLAGFHRPLSLQCQPGIPSAEQAQAVGEAVSASLWRWGRGSACGKKQRFPRCLVGLVWALGDGF